MTQKKVHITTVGCPKNQVDSEVLAAKLKANGYALSDTPEGADISVVNTCGFIDAAKQESIETILQIAEQKKTGSLKKLVVTGCLVQRYKKELKEGLTEVDAFFGTDELTNILGEFGAKNAGNPVDKYDLLGERVLSTPPHYAYLKISEGCDNPCSFCAIPMMRGKHVSRTADSLVRETEMLAGKGVKELIVIGQDTTYYGLDIHGRRELPSLMKKLNEVSGIEWIRLMYAYPAKFPDELLDVMRDSDNIVKYIDIPIQHISDRMLKSMRRGITKDRLLELLYRIREKVPGIAIRTTLIVGYPGEGEREFEELLQFVNEFKFDRLGAFTYSVEEGTAAAILGDPVPQEEKERRHAAIMEAQRLVIAGLNEKKVGTKQVVIIDRKEGDNFVGRTSYDAPEIDSEVIITSKRPLEVGYFAEVVIDDSYEHDLYATAV
ncbi:MAG: 30S ribosomal protein S12 methylthiotransferase RimO [Bacteroidetes bacterium]|nr:30S ribosomal protein S12 methylthiotransferase RimO [Bacteroidota bacterium]